jgi:hypothetical protein
MLKGGIQPTIEVTCRGGACVSGDLIIKNGIGPSDNNIVLWPAAGSLKIIGDSKVGIGTDSPQTKLDIYDSNSGPLLSMRGLDTNYRGMKIANTSNSEKWFIGNNNSNNFVIRNAGTTDYLTILNSNGNVGIGTTEPGEKLTIQDNFARILLQTIQDPSNYRTTLENLYSYSNPFNLKVKVGGYEDTVIKVMGGGSPYYGVSTQIGGTSSNTLTFYAGTTERMRIDYNGNVGIGTTGPNTKLDVNGSIRTRPASTATCNANTVGSIYYDSDDCNFYGCKYYEGNYTWDRLNVTTGCILP